MKTFIKILKSAFRLAEAAVGVYVWYYYLIVVKMMKIGIKDFFIMVGALILFLYSLYCIGCYMSDDDDNPGSILEFIVDGIDSNPNVGEGHLNSTQRMDVQEFTRVFNNYNKRYRR